MTWTVAGCNLYSDFMQSWNILSWKVSTDFIRLIHLKGGENICYGSFFQFLSELSSL